MRSIFFASLLCLVGCTRIPNPVTSQYISFKIQPNGNVTMLVPVISKVRSQPNQTSALSAAMCLETRPIPPNSTGFLHLPNIVNFCFKVKW